MHPLHDVLVAAAEGRFPQPDGAVEVHPPMPGGTHAVVELTGHAVVLTDRAAHDVVLVARGRGGDDGALVERTDFDDHPRAVRARRHRRDVRIFGDARGFVTLGFGLVDRLEISVEVVDSATGRGAGRSLIADALGALAADQLVWAQVAPGNAASMRAFLAAGFKPIGAETLIEPCE